MTRHRRTRPKRLHELLFVVLDVLGMPVICFSYESLHRNTVISSALASVVASALLTARIIA